MQSIPQHERLEKYKDYLADAPPTLVRLEIKPHWEALSDREKLYAHYISIAAWSGTRVVCRQISPESEHIYAFIIHLHKAYKGDWVAIQSAAKLDDHDRIAFLNYAAQFLGNNGNYKSFGDSKFIPRLEPDKLEAIASLTPETSKIWSKLGISAFYETEPTSLMHLGYPDHGHLSSYYPNSPHIKEKEILAVNKFLQAQKLLPENTRLRKIGNDFELLIASAQENPTLDDRDVSKTEWTLDGELHGSKLTLKYGDSAKEMAKIAEALLNAGKHAANEEQKAMMTEYVKAFTTGSNEAYKNSQRHWIGDQGPTVECDIGFIETYRDPAGVKGEWEGFAAIVNKERTQAFGKLVQAAPELIPKLPWDKSFEKDKFLSPDFTSLEVLTFAGSGIPAGINIPNFDDIRQHEGFKNVSLGNVLSAKSPSEKVPFIADNDQEVYEKYRNDAFEVQVGLHELTGHGCGKLLQEERPGEYNFDYKNPPINPLTGKPITSWYKPGQTWSSVFGPLSSSIEECRAECVAMALGCEFSVLKLFGFGNGQIDMDGIAGDVLYTAYLSMARAGIAALEFWDPKNRKWGQAHMQARYSIMRTFLDAGDKLMTLNHSKDDCSDLVISMDRSKILTVGRKAVEKYLLQLHIYKATADFEAAKHLYDSITNVDDFFEHKIRPVVLSKKLPRKCFVQANTMIDNNGKVILKEYEATAEGMIQSFVDRDYTH